MKQEQKNIPSKEQLKQLLERQTGKLLYSSLDTK